MRTTAEVHYPTFLTVSPEILREIGQYLLAIDLHDWTELSLLLPESFIGPINGWYRPETPAAHSVPACTPYGSCFTRCGARSHQTALCSRIDLGAPCHSLNLLAVC